MSSIALIVVATLLLLALLLVLRNRARRREQEEESVVPFLIPVNRQAPLDRDRMTRAEPSSFAPPAVQTAPEEESGFAPAPPPVRPQPVRPVTAQTPPAGAKFEGTLQLLPGRFEIVAGEDTRREIRFVRNGPLASEITLGRGEGPLHSHVQLGSRTVSRLHARLRFESGYWSILNLSPTNPVVLNGEQLNGDPRPLNDGDQVELGEVVLRFHPR